MNVFRIKKIKQLKEKFIIHCLNIKFRQNSNFKCLSKILLYNYIYSRYIFIIISTHDEESYCYLIY